MSQFDDAVAACKKQLDDCKVDYNDDDVKAVAKSLGPSLYNADANLVAASDKSEIDRIKKNFVSGKLGVEGDDADAAIQYAIDTLGTSNRNKLRPSFYYLIAKKLNKESALG